MQKTVLISGGLGDIGKAIAILFCNVGYNVSISDLLSPIDAEPLLAEMRANGCTGLSYHKVNVSVESEVLAWIDAVAEKWGSPQVIVANAGIVVAGEFSDSNLKTDDVKKQMDVNFWGSYYLTVHASRKLKQEALPGRIVFIGSWAAERPATRIASYCVSKAAVRMLCKTLALELANDDILVNEVAPGIVEGGLAKQNQQKNPALLKTHLDSTPTHALVSTKEVAKHVLRLCDFEDMSITGSTILVDGGLSLTSKMTP